MTSVHLAQINVSRLKGPAPEQLLAVMRRINRRAELSPGFVWRLPDHVADGLTLINLSVWESYEPMHDFLYRSEHGLLVSRRARWFEPSRGTALWWVPAGHEPTVDEGLERLGHLRTHGPTPRAFTVRRRFPPA